MAFVLIAATRAADYCVEVASAQNSLLSTEMGPLLLNAVISGEESSLGRRLPRLLAEWNSKTKHKRVRKRKGEGA